MQRFGLFKAFTQYNGTLDALLDGVCGRAALPTEITGRDAPATRDRLAGSLRTAHAARAANGHALAATDALLGQLYG